MADKPKQGTDVAKVGRPTLYQEAYAEQAFKLCLLGATNEQLADFFGVAVATIHNWKDAHPEFLDALKAGKEEADSRVAQSLYRRALGYEHSAVKILSYEGESFEHEYTEKYPPDTTAAIFWLKNRQPHLWRDRKEVTGPDGQPLFKVYQGIEDDDV